MKPQDRTRAILLSKVETSLRIVLVVLADAMLEERETCWLAVETIAERAGLCERQTREVLNSAEERGIVRRWSGEHKSRDIAIDWEVLAQAEPPKSTRGGSRPAKTAGEPAKTATQPAKTAGDTTGKDCHPDRQSLPPQPAKTATFTGKDCPRSGKEAGSEAGMEAGTPLPPTGGTDGGSACGPDHWCTPTCRRFGRCMLTLPTPERPCPTSPTTAPTPPAAPSPAPPASDASPSEPSPTPSTVPGSAPSGSSSSGSLTRPPNAPPSFTSSAGTTSTDLPLPVRIGSLELPPDLPALLDGGDVCDGLRTVGRVHVVNALLGAGIEDTASLLRVPAAQWRGPDGRCFVRGLGPAVRDALEAFLVRRWGVALGALAPAPQVRSAFDGGVSSTARETRPADWEKAMDAQLQREAEEARRWAESEKPKEVQHGA
jgi:hypothetical protein